LVALLSDAAAKEDIKDGSKDIQKFLDVLSSSSYKYKKDVKDLPGATDKRRYGPMAQEIEKSAVGKTMVSTDPKTGLKQVDLAGILSASLAANADLHKRLSKIEKK
jgi:hypothetical protein